MPENTNIAKRIILDFLDFIRFKIENDSLTLEEADAIAKTIELAVNWLNDPDNPFGDHKIWGYLNAK